MIIFQTGRQPIHSGLQNSVSPLSPFTTVCLVSKRYNLTGLKLPDSQLAVCSPSPAILPSRIYFLLNSLEMRNKTRHTSTWAHFHPLDTTPHPHPTPSVLTQIRHGQVHRHTEGHDHILVHADATARGELWSKVPLQVHRIPDAPLAVCSVCEV